MSPWNCQWDQTAATAPLMSFLQAAFCEGNSDQIRDENLLRIPIGELVPKGNNIPETWSSDADEAVFRCIRLR
jgi:hypothetical protein